MMARICCPYDSENYPCYPSCCADYPLLYADFSPVATPIPNPVQGRTGADLSSAGHDGSGPRALRGFEGDMRGITFIPSILSLSGDSKDGPTGKKPGNRLSHLHSGSAGIVRRSPGVSSPRRPQKLPPVVCPHTP
jgi:hypothetical protein